MMLEYLQHMRSYFTELLISSGIELLREAPTADLESFVNKFLPSKDEIVTVLKNHSVHERQNKSEMQSELSETLNRIESNLSRIRGARMMCMHNDKTVKSQRSRSAEPDKSIPKSVQKNKNRNSNHNSMYYHCNYKNQHKKNKQSNQPQVWVYHPAHWMSARLVSKK